MYPVGTVVTEPALSSDELKSIELFPELWSVFKNAWIEVTESPALSLAAFNALTNADLPTVNVPLLNVANGLL